MDATQELAGIAAGVSEEANRMSGNTEAVLRGIRSIEEISEVVKNGIAEIEIGTNDMNAAMIHVSDLQVRSGESIEKLREEVSVFKTE